MKWLESYLPIGRYDPYPERFSVDSPQVRAPHDATGMRVDKDATGMRVGKDRMAALEEAAQEQDAA
ncbi:hypothetical protein AMK16_25935 [Streptomyces sp. CB00455]|nr:hypothetical protein AMK16_25935 [Streptomyces sp. CB00455]